MLTRRLLRCSQTSSPLLRTFTTTTAHQRTPALGDITPNGASEFDKRQANFREQVRAAEKAKKEQDSQSSSVHVSKSPTAPHNAVHGAAPTAPTAPSASDASSSSSSSDIGHVALGSLSTHDTEAARQNSSKHESSKRKGALSSLIYGTHEGQQMDQEIEKSFSQVLARGKYVHSIVMHSVKPDKVDEYVKLVGDWYPKVAGRPENHVHLVGSWRTEVGDCDTFGKDPRLLDCSRREKLADSVKSAYMGIRTLPRLPCLPPLHPTPPGLPRLRRHPQNPHNPQTNLPHARILLLAHHAPTHPRRALRTPLLHPPPGQPPRMGDALAERAKRKERSHGGRGRVVRAGRRSEYRASPVAVCELGGAEGEAGDELGGRGVGGYGAQDCAADSDDEESDSDAVAVESGCLSEMRREDLDFPPAVCVKILAKACCLLYC